MQVATVTFEHGDGAARVRHELDDGRFEVVRADQHDFEITLTPPQVRGMGRLVAWSEGKEWESEWFDVKTGQPI